MFVLFWILLPQEVAIKSVGEGEFNEESRKVEGQDLPSCCLGGQGAGCCQGSHTSHFHRKPAVLALDLSRRLIMHS